MSIEIVTEDARWNALDLAGMAAEVETALCEALALDADLVEIGLLACDDARIAVLNGSFRDKPQPTNVLSWPADDLSPDLPGGVPLRPQADVTGEIALGDIAIAWDTCAREAEAAGIAMPDHVRHLLLHGMLHLLGYDHVRDPDATVMEGLEVEILGRLGIDDPYSHSTGA